MEPHIEINIEDIDEKNLKDIPEPCKGCVYWECPDDFEAKKGPEKRGEFEAEKREWFQQTMKEFGTCGKIVYYEDKPIAYAQYAPSERFARAGKSKQVDKIKDVVFLSCLFVTNKAFRDKGIGERLLHSIIEDLRRRQFKAVETIARRGVAYNPAGPMMFYVRNGFHIKDNTTPEYPLMRLFL